MYVRLISLVLYDTYKLLRAIVLLFCSNFFQSFWCNGKSIPFQWYWPIKGLIFDILWALFSMFWWFNAAVNVYWKQLPCFLFFGSIVAILFFNHSGEPTYDPPLQACFMKMIIQQVNAIVSKSASFHWFF